MKQRVLIACLTILVLGAGYLAGVWTERNSCKVPPPPQLLGELSPHKKSTTAAAQAQPVPKAAELAAEIAKLRPEIEAFRSRMQEIDREMDHDIEGILRPEQLVTFRAMVKKYADLRDKEDADLNLATPLTAEEITRLQQKPLYKMLAIVVVPMRLEWNSHDLSLDAAQKEQLRGILRARRDKFIALVDSSPPPSLTLSRLAAVAQRLSDPKK